MPISSPQVTEAPPEFREVSGDLVSADLEDHAASI